MRANSMASKLMKRYYIFLKPFERFFFSYSALIGKEFLRKVLGPEVQKICQNPREGNVFFEVDPGSI
jgi:hypothetical protein